MHLRLLILPLAALALASACGVERDAEIATELQGAAADCPMRLFPDGDATFPAVTDPRNLELGTRFRVKVDGLITGARYARTSASPGPQTFHLWSPNGDLLRTEIAPATPADGWAEVRFSQPVVAVPGDVYVISIQLPGGNFRTTNGSRPQPAGPIERAQNAFPYRAYSGVYGTGGTYPTIQTGYEYFVDVFVEDATPPSAVTSFRQTSVSASAAVLEWNAATDASGSLATPVTSYLLFRDGVRIATLGGAVLRYDDTSLTAATTYRYAIRSEDWCGNTSADATVDVTTTNAPPPLTGETIFGEGAAGPRVASTDPAAVEVGVKLRSTVAGSIKGVRFWRDSGSTSGYVVNLWTAAGTRLATASGAGGPVPGWQEIAFATPVTIEAGTTYVASYFSPNGRFSYTFEGLSNGVTSGSLTALSNAAAGGNGVYAYSAGQGSRFPGQTYRSSNYWVDVRFEAGTPPPPAETFTIYGDETPAGIGASSGRYWIGVRFQARSTGEVRAVRFFRMQAYGAAATTVALWSAGGALLGQGARNTGSTVGWDEIALDAAVLIDANTTYVAAYDVGPFPYRPRGLASARDNGELVALAGGGVFAEWSPNAPVFPDRSYDSYEYFVDVRFARVTPPANPMQTTLGTDPPVGAGTVTGGAPVEMGNKIRIGANGFVHAVRLYRTVAPPAGTRVSLWRTDGTLLATAVSSATGTAGWYEIAFSTLVTVSAGDVVVASYHSPDGAFVYQPRRLRDDGITRGDLAILRDGEMGPNSLYRYSATSAFPTAGFDSSLYFVDVRFSR